MTKLPQLQLDLDAIEQRFSDCRAWEERYRQLLLLAKGLGKADPTLRQESHLIDGCESDVWLSFEQQQLQLDSNAKIIRGLLVMLLACLDSYPLSQAQSEFAALLTRLGLAQHLSESRNNGLQGIWQTLHAIAQGDEQTFCR